MPTPGPLELVIILVIALLILGPGKLPDVGSALGQEHPRIPQGVLRPGRSVKVDTSPLPPTPQETPATPAAVAPPADVAPPAPAAVAPTTAETPATPEPVATAASAGTGPSEPTTGTN